MYCPSNITDIQQVFKLISAQLNQTEKHFQKLIIYETDKLKVQDYLVLNDLSFWDITFDHFEGYNIKLISSNAFGQASKTLNSIYNWYGLNHVNHQPPEHDIWKVLSSLVNIQDINVALNINEIPSQAFVPLKGKQSKLNLIRLYTYKAITIKKMAFFHLENLNYLDFYFDIAKVESQAFAMSKKSSEKLKINFRHDFDGDAFQNSSFQGIQRSVEMNFYQHVNYIPESSFKTILENQNNHLYFSPYSAINCDDCKNVWMIKDKKVKQVVDAKCNHNFSLTLFDSQVENDLRSKCKTNFTLNL